MVGLVRDYLSKRVDQQLEELEEVERILDSLMKLKSRVLGIVEGAEQNPRILQCLIHQNACSASFLFRYAIQSHKQEKHWKEVEKADDVRTEPEEEKRQASPPPPSSNELPPKGRRDCLEKGLKREVMIINWRTASFGSPMTDVAFLLMTALPPKTRRAETSSLLRLYLNSFQVMKYLDKSFADYFVVN